MADFVEVAGLEQIRPGTGSRFIIEDKEMAIFNVDGTICAISDTCPHAGGSLGMGKLDGKIVTCPVHGMKFDVTTGCFAGTSDFGVASYKAKVVDGDNHGVDFLSCLRFFCRAGLRFRLRGLNIPDTVRNQRRCVLTGRPDKALMPFFLSCGTWQAGCTGPLAPP